MPHLKERANTLGMANNTLVFASRTATQGLVLLEATALGVPVASTAVLRTKDILRDRCGYDITEENATRFGSVMTMVLHDAPRRARLSALAYAYAQEWNESKLRTNSLNNIGRPSAHINSLPEPPEPKSRLQMKHNASRLRRLFCEIVRLEENMKENILFVCANNACHSQMAEGWARYLGGGDRFEFLSAGLERHELDVYAVKVMAEAGVDISSHSPKSLYALRRIPFDLVVTMSEQSSDASRFFSGATPVLHCEMEDPRKLQAVARSEAEVVELYRRARDEIGRFVGDMLSESHVQPRRRSGGLVLAYQSAAVP